MSNLQQCNDLLRPIPGYEGLYLAHRYGFIVALPKIYSIRINSKYKENYCMKPKIDHKGYLRVMLRNGDCQKGFLVHRLIGLAFLENPNGLPQINHKDGNKFNNRVENIEWVTASENILHAYKTGLKDANKLCGIDSPALRFNRVDIEAIREDKRSVRQIALELKASRKTISNIKNRISYDFWN